MELLILIVMFGVAFTAGRASKKQDPTEWADGFRYGYAAGLDETLDILVHREGDRRDA